MLAKKEVITTSHSIRTMHLVLETVEDDGTSLQQLEKLSKLESAVVANPTKPAIQKVNSNSNFLATVPTAGPSTAIIPNFSFTPLVANGDRSDKLPASRPVEPVIKASRFNGGKIPPESLKRRISNGGIQKSSYKSVNFFYSP